ncbi:hypothetical protein V1264_004348 [Littorina saxatilis]|uniref:GTP-binding protein 8 n=3 Tax=Littorina saxatilis TaxID=31220 RepID=A0AAN9B1W2_9CAEN
MSISFRGIKTDHCSKSFVNPLLELQRFVSVPILSEQQDVFNPTEDEVMKGVSFFSGLRGSSKHSARFIGSYSDGGELPESDLPEVCFLGRSNVGKSSLISCLLFAHPQVRVSVSSKPGHTKKLNLYRVGSHFTLVDMPGYGHGMPPSFQHSVETYLSTRRRLCRTFLLVDGDTGLTGTDLTALDMLKEFGISYVIVLTKIDKAGRHKLLTNLMKILEVSRHKAGHTCFSQPFLVSSKNGDGVMLLQTFIAYLTGCVQIKGL